MLIVTGGSMNHLRCPSCRELDWYLDGLTLVEVDDGRLEVERAERSILDGRGAQWSCMACGHEVLPWTQLAQSLHRRSGSELQAAS